jgi:hypothetical protein
MEEMIDRQSLHLSGVLLIAGVVVFGLATLFHPGAGISDNDEAGTFKAYANSTY